MAFVEFDKVGKTYHMGEVSIEALRDASFSIEKGELVVIVGPSGAGKTTLLNILGGMDSLTTGTVKLDGQEISKFNKKQLTQYIFPASFPAVNSSVLRLPVLLRRIPSYCCVMSLPAHWITRPARQF